MGASGIQRLMKSVLLAGVVLLAGCLVTACAQNARAAVAAVAASSPSAGAPATATPPPSTPTTGPTAAPTTASPTAAPSTASTAPSPTPSSSSSATSGSGANLIWLWFVLGALVLLGIILLATRSPSRSSSRRRSPVEASNWHSRAVDAYAKGAAFDGAVHTAERLDASSEAASIHWADLRRRADDLTEVLYAMRETAPTDHRRAQVENAILSLRAVRDAFEAQRPLGGAGSQQGGVLRSQLSALESALNALRIPDDRLG
jgi:hypothetical protein